MPYYSNRRTPPAPEQSVFPYRKGDIVISRDDTYHYTGVLIVSGTGGRVEWAGVTKEGKGDPKVKVIIVYEDGHVGPECWYNVSDVRHASVDEAAFISDVLSRKITHAELEAERSEREDDPYQLADTVMGRQIAVAAREAGTVTFRARIEPAFTEPKARQEMLDAETTWPRPLAEHEREFAATTAPPPVRPSPVISIPPTTKTPRTRPAPTPKPDARPGAPRGGVPSLAEAADDLLAMLEE